LFLSLALMIAPARVHALDLHVTDASLEAHPMNYSGPCPGVIKFKGKITADAPGTVKYTFTRSDGATGPVYRLDFVTAGTQEVETVWTLGDSSVLPHYEGWQTIKILAPNELESNTAKFVLDCKQGNGPQPQPQPNPGLKPGNTQTQADGVALYQSILPGLDRPQLEQLQADLNKLKPFSEELQSKFDRATPPANFNRQKMEEEFRSILKEPDFEKRNQLIEGFRQRYEQQFLQQTTAAGIDLATERQRMSSLLGFTADTVSPDVLADSRNLRIDRMRPLEAVPAERLPATVSNNVLDSFRPPYSDGGTAGTDVWLAHASANPVDGSVEVNTSTVYMGTTRTRAFLLEKLPVRVGTRRVRVAVEFDDINFSTRADSIFGSVSAEARVNLRVLNGPHVLASTDRSLGRAVTTFYGFGGPSGRGRPLTITCEFERDAPERSEILTMVIEFEGVIGVNGAALGNVYMTGKPRQFAVTSFF